MSELRYAGLLGGIFEASDIARDEGVSVETAFEIQAQRDAERVQAYLDADREIESNVVYGVPFGRPKPGDTDTRRGAL